MNKNHYIRKADLRFRRWSRKSYAIFRSLHLTVTIGTLDVSMQKQSEVKSSVLTPDFQRDNEEDKLEDLLISEQESTLELINENNTSEAAASGVLITYYHF